VQRHRVLVSAHRCGYAELGTVGGQEDPVAGIAHSAAIGADYCEFDVRRCADGTFVVAHDPDGGIGDESVVISDLTWDELCRSAPDVCRLDVLLEALRVTDMGAHVDMKFRTPPEVRAAGDHWEVDLASVLVEHLDPDKIVFTAGVRATTTSLRAWADQHAPGLVVALSIGGSVRGMTWRQAVQRRWGEFFPRLRFERSHADAVAAHFVLARVRLARWTTRIGVPLLVWTVDSPRLQRRFLHDRRIWMITTNWPARAIALRDGHPSLTSSP
jgi:glycerophosphoryl diester phosphodiesterase